MAFVHVESEGRVALVRIDRPKVNALSLELLSEIEECFGQLHREPPGSVVITGGDRIFSAGADINELNDKSLSKEIANAFGRALGAVASLPRVVIAAISGVALGGGCELALACDFRYASSKARLGQPEILLGVIPGGGATQRLARLVGPARAKDLIWSGRQVQADEARAMGLLDKVFEADDLMRESLEQAAMFAEGALFAQGLAKRAIDAGLDGDLESGLALERELFLEAFSSKDSEIGLASFLAEGPGHARFVGH